MPYRCKDNDWTLEEYKSLRSEVVERIKMQKQLEVFSLTAAALIWGGASISDVPEMAVWVGVCAALVIFACALLAAYESQAIFKIGAYIAAKFERDPELGLCWDSMTHDKRIPMYATRRMPLNRHSIYYLMLILVNLCFSFGFAVSVGGGLQVDASTLIQAVVLVAVSASIIHPLVKNERAYSSKEQSTEKWIRILDERCSKNSEPSVPGDA